MKKSKTWIWKLMGIWLVSAVFMAFISGCVPQQEPPAEGGFDWTIIVFLVLMFAIVYFLIIRPQRKKQKEHEGQTGGEQFKYLFFQHKRTLGDNFSFFMSSIILQIRKIQQTINVCQAGIPGIIENMSENQLRRI